MSGHALSGVTTREPAGDSAQRVAQRQPNTPALFNVERGPLSAKVTEGLRLLKPGTAGLTKSYAR